MKDYLIPLLMGIMLVITIVATSVYGQTTKEAQALITRSVDELLVDKVII